jgi:hypothetical protein
MAGSNKDSTEKKLHAQISTLGSAFQFLFTPFLDSDSFKSRHKKPRFGPHDPERYADEKHKELGQIAEIYYHIDANFHAYMSESQEFSSIISLILFSGSCLRQYTNVDWQYSLGRLLRRVVQALSIVSSRLRTKFSIFLLAFSHWRKARLRREWTIHESGNSLDFSPKLINSSQFHSRPCSMRTRIQAMSPNCSQIRTLSRLVQSVSFSMVHI